MPTLFQETSSNIPSVAKSPKIFHKKTIIIFGITLLVILIGGAAAYYFIYFRAPNVPKYSEEQILSFIREEYLPSVVSVYCANEDGGEEYYSGSGIYYAPEDGEKDFGTVNTNAHVVLGDDGKFHGCNIYFPWAQTGGFYDSSYYAGNVYLYHDKVAVIDEASVSGIDFATLYLTEPNKDTQGISYPFPPVQKGFYRPVEIGKQWGTCSDADAAKLLNFGDKLIVMGYPGIGSKTLTFTEGTISGFLGNYNEQIKVSAIMNSGNSGGIAINALTGCFIGVPSAGTIARGSNIGILLASSFVNKFIENLTGESMYSPNPEGKDLVVFDIPEKGSLKYPSSWSVEPTEGKSFLLDGKQKYTFTPGDLVFTDFSGAHLISPSGYYFNSPLESVLDNAQEYFRFSVYAKKNTTLNGAVDAAVQAAERGLYNMEKPPIRFRVTSNGLSYAILLYSGELNGETIEYAQYIYVKDGEIAQFIFPLYIVDEKRFLEIFFDIMPNSVILY